MGWVWLRGRARSLASRSKGHFTTEASRLFRGHATLSPPSSSSTRQIRQISQISQLARRRLSLLPKPSRRELLRSQCGLEEGRTAVPRSKGFLLAAQASASALAPARGRRRRMTPYKTQHRDRVLTVGLQDPGSANARQGALSKAVRSPSFQRLRIKTTLATGASASGSALVSSHLTPI